MSAIRVMGVERAELGECPVWDDDTGSLLWIDITTGRILRHHLGGEGTADTEVARFDQPVGAIAPCRGGGLLAALADGIVHRDPEGRIERLVDTSRSAPRHRFNDGACDSRGRFFTGSTALEFGSELGALYRLDPDGTFTVALDGLAFPNGIVLTPDGKKLYLAESQKNCVHVYEVTGPGKVGKRKLFADLPRKREMTPQIDNQPDGMCLDAAGNLYVAHYGMKQVQVLNPEGKLIRQFDGGNVTTSNVAFSGPKMDQLFITGGIGPEAGEGGLFRIDIGVKGLVILTAKK